MPYRYIPVVRSKAGEADALGNLTAAARSNTFPLIRLTAAIPTTFQQRMTTQLNGFPIALDGTYNFDSTGSAAAFTALFHGLGSNNIPITPAISTDSDPAYIAAASALIGQYAPGLVLQTPIATLPSVLNWVVQIQGWNPSDVDLIVDAGGVAQHDPALFANYLSHTISSNIPSNHPWRTVTLHCWSAPQDHGPLSYGRNIVPRNDWRVWEQVRQQVPFQIDYSDSGHVHPSLEEVPGYAMANATVSVRYAIDNSWLIYKGVATTGPNGVSMRTQYQNHAQNLIAEPSFGGLNGCWGDSRISHYATTTGGTGGRPQWAAILLNRHISLVSDRLP